MNEEHVIPINIIKYPYKGNICFNIETVNGDTAFIALTTPMEVLRIESLVVAGVKNLEGMIPTMTTKFEKFIKSASVDMAAAIEDSKKSGDLVNIEILTNFNELFLTIIDTVPKRTTKKNGTETQR